MAIVEAINIPIGVTGQQSVDSAANSYEDLGDAVAKTQLEAEKLAQQFGINDKRTQEAIKVAGRYKQQMEELDFAIDGARGGVDQLFRASQGIVAGFEVAAGAAALFGSESEELEKVLMKVQGAMVLSQGIKDLKEFAPAISNLAGIVRGRVVAAFSTLRTAIISTGIGALAVAVGLLIANWDSLVKKFNLSIPTLGEIGTKIGNIVQGFTDFLGLTSEAERTNDKINQSIAKNISETQKQIAIAKAKGEQDKALALEENQRAAELVLAKRKLRQEDSEENKKAVEDAKHNLELTRIAQENYRKDQLAKQREAAKQRQEQIKQQQDEEFELFVQQELANYEYRQKLAEDERQREEEEFNAWLDQELANYEYRKELADKEVEEEKARKQAVADLEQKLFDESQALANAVIALAGEQSRIGKAIALASIGADTAMALSKALANSQSPTPDNVATGGLAGIAKYIGLATTILTNAKRAYDIIKAPAPGGVSGGGGASASASVPRFNAPSTRLPGGGDEFTQVRRVYVTETDITNVQEKVKVTEKLSQF
jgi:chemotaxis protein histidine kinase CheA